MFHTWHWPRHSSASRTGFSPGQKMFSLAGDDGVVTAHLVHAGDVRAAASVCLALCRVGGRGRGGKVCQDGDLSVELVRPGRPLAAVGVGHLEAGQLVSSEAGLPVVTPLGQLFRNQFTRQNQILQPRALTFLLGAD